MPAVTNIAASAPRVELDTEDADFDLGYDPSSFETKQASRPTTADGKQTPDSPTLGAAQPSPSGSTLAEEEGVVGRESKFAEQMAAPATETVSANTFTSAGSSTTTPPSSSHVVNPATIPIRTSSSNAVTNGDKHERHSMQIHTPEKSRTSPKHRSLGSVPEERRYSHRPHPDERDWIAQSRTHSNGGAARSTHTTFSQQPTLTSSISHPEPLRSSLPHTSDFITTSPSATWSAEKENILKGPFDYLESHPGKDIRAQLIAAFNTWLRVPAPSLEIITKVVGMLHTASLLIDDVEDSSLLRRGVPVAHQIFGVAQTINSANYVYFCALQELLKLNNPECITIYTEELLNLHRGQGMDLFWRDTLTCPSEDDYLEMVGNKTGGLFRLAIKLMCAESPSHNHGHTPDQPPADYIPLVNTIGLLFQILDDYRNLSSSTYTANKGLCEDLTEGKFSFPIIHAIRSDPNNLVLINILKQKTQDEEVKRYAVAYMERVGSFAYTRRVLRGLTKRAVGMVEELEGLGVGGVDGALGKESGGDGVKKILELMKVEKHERGSQSV